MKQFIFILVLFCLSSSLSAQNKNQKFSTASFEKTFRQTPIIINVRKAQKSPKLRLPRLPNLIWKHHPETVSYYNNHRANHLCFNQSSTQGWEMIQVRPMKHQVLHDAAIITAGAVAYTILHLLSNQ